MVCKKWYCVSRNKQWSRWRTSTRKWYFSEDYFDCLKVKFLELREFPWLSCNSLCAFGFPIQVLIKITIFQRDVIILTLWEVLCSEYIQLLGPQPGPTSKYVLISYNWSGRKLWEGFNKNENFCFQLEPWKIPVSITWIM